MTEQMWEPGGYLIIQWSTGRWGVSVDYVNSGDAVEVKIGQGAKPGMGGHLLGAKVTEDVSRGARRAQVDPTHSARAAIMTCRRWKI